MSPLDHDDRGLPEAATHAPQDAAPVAREVAGGKNGNGQHAKSQKNRALAGDRARR